MSSNVLVIDNGAYALKIGLANWDEPNSMPNCITKAKSEKRRIFVANQIDECRDAAGLYFTLAFQKGYIVNWEVQKTVWDYVFGENCMEIDLKDTCVIITEPYFNFIHCEETLTEIFFEEYKVQSLLRINSGTLSEHNYMASEPEALCCLVVDSGYSFTHVTPYIKGIKYRDAIVRIDVGGKLLTNHLKELISYRQLNVMEETFVINQVKEDACYVSMDFNEDMKLSRKSYPENSVVRDYVLPDYTNINRGYLRSLDEPVSKEYQTLRLGNERFTIPEILFHPSDIGVNQMGIAEAIVASVSACPPKAHPHLYNNIVVTGGNACFTNFSQRLYKELRALVPDVYELRIALPSNPIDYAWEGGALLGKESELHTHVVLREEYLDLGMAVCHERFNVN